MQVIKSDVYKKKELSHLTNVPKHIAIIMDGNRRWAKKHNLPSIVGHTKGAETLTNIVKASIQLKIKIITVFAFSTENWSRTDNEIHNLMNLFDTYLKTQLPFMLKEKIRLSVIGDLSKLPISLQESFHQTTKKTKNGDSLDLALAVNYGSKDEIRRALFQILNDYENKKISKKDITEELITQYLDTKNFKDPDLLIRTSGEQRLSNFMLWQLSYSEIYVTETLWPDFSENDFLLAINEYQKRKRRLGGA